MKEELSLNPVQPVRPIAPYIGGKRALAGRLVKMIEEVPHELYAEPFVGMGGVFFRRRHRPRKEVINDINGEVVNVFRHLQRHYQQLLDTMKFQLCSRKEFERLVATDPKTLTELERASRFIYLQRTAFGGKVRGQSYGISFEAGSRFDMTKLVPILEETYERLCGVDIECLGYAQLIGRYDRPGALFYLDPPYHGNEQDYGSGVFSEADFELLRDALEAVEGHFIMSINDTPFIRETFAGFTIEEVSLNYRVSGKVTPARELFISGCC